MLGTYKEQFASAAAEGFAGIEAPLPSREKEDEFIQLLEEFRLDYIAQVITFGDHIQSFADQVKRVTDFCPVLIVSHSAKDGMDLDQQLHFFKEALRVEEKSGVPVGHETHRSRAMFTPWSTVKLLKELPELKITADFSHWCCVTESLLEEYEEEVFTAIAHAVHIHGRVGYAQGPQVPHPGAPEYRVELERFETWWKEILESRRMSGYEWSTITPEFGPPGYMHTLPFTNQPIVDLLTANVAVLPAHWLVKVDGHAL